MLLIKKKNIQIHSDGSLIFSHLFKEKLRKTKFYVKDYKKLYSNKKKFKEINRSLKHKNKYFK
jgi:hypothetical protein